MYKIVLPAYGLDAALHAPKICRLADRASRRRAARAAVASQGRAQG